MKDKINSFLLNILEIAVNFLIFKIIVPIFKTIKRIKLRLRGIKSTSDDIF